MATHPMIPLNQVARLIGRLEQVARGKHLDIAIILALDIDPNGTTAARVADILGRPHSTIHHQMIRLLDAGHIRYGRRDLPVTYTPSPEARRTIDRLLAQL